MFRSVQFTILMLSCLLFMGSSRFPNTSADPKTRMLTLKIFEDVLQVHLDNPGVHVYYFSDHTIRKLEFQQLNKHVELIFHHTGVPEIEHVAQIQRFNIVDHLLYLDGSTQTFDIDGHLITESHWRQGRLDGLQRHFNSFQVLIEQREYKQGYPIGTWQMNYADGTPAARISFPETLTDWEESQGTLPKTSVAQQELHEMPYPKVLRAVETWYNQDGIKQKEKEFLLYMANEQIIVEDAGTYRTFDHAGRLLRAHSVPAGNGVETSTIYTDLGTHRQKVVWINGGQFRDESIFYPRR